MKSLTGWACIIAMSFALSAHAADYPAQKTGVWIAKDLKFHTGESLPEAKLAYTTIGDPKNETVIVLHGTGQSSAGMLSAGFAGNLFGPGQPLDASKFHIVIPDAIGHGQSSKPSDGLRAKFPKYNYSDMVEAQHRLVTEGLGIRHARLVIGNSMGGMHTWLWGEKYPGFMDALAPMAAQPTAMSSRNWMLRRMMLESIRSDAEYKDGDYITQPRSLKYAAIFYGIATAGGTLNYQKQAPTQALADKLVDTRLAAPFTTDANDFLWQWGSSGDYDAAPGLDKIEAWLLAINAADDERNPPETGLMVEALKKVRHGKLHLIPASEQTSGHLTTGNAAFYARELDDLLKNAPRRAR